MWLSLRFMHAGLHPVLAGGLVLAGLTVASFHFYVRPHMATIILLGFIMGWIVDFERGRISAERWWWLIPITIIWTNLHGGVLGGLATVGLAGAGWSVMALWRRDGPIRSWSVFFLLLGIFALSGLAVLVNPFGIGMLKLWGSILNSKIVPQIVSEHQPVQLTNLNGQALVGFGAFYLLMLAGTWPMRPRVAWLLPLVWFALSLHSIRHGPLFCAVALVALADLLPHTIWYRWLQKHGETLVRATPSPPNVNWRSFALPALLTALCLGLALAHARVPVIGSGWVRLDPTEVPVDLLEPLQEYAQSRPEGAPIFNDANFGGFLIYYTPNLRIFMDDRCELYGDAWMAEYMEMIEHHPERIETYRAKYGFDRAVITVGSPMDRYLGSSSRWVEVARGRAAVLYATRKDDQ
jgi:hypothetical protein